MSEATRRALPYGSWPTPITSEMVVVKVAAVWDVAVDGDDVLWSELRPAEGGRTPLIRLKEGSKEELLPETENVRTAVHEYGGGAWWARDGVVWYASWTDQRLYRRDPATGAAEPLTPEPETPRGDRYADGDVSPDGQWIACVREHHPAGGRGAVDVRNEVVRLAAQRPSTPEPVVSGPDFVSNPRWNAAGDRLSWIEWDHPNMPWDGTRLVVRDLAAGGERLVAGGYSESVSDPQWQPDGSLLFISDRTGWWNLYRWPGEGDAVQPLVEIEAEIGEPQWVFGNARYTALEDGRIVFARWRDGMDGLAVRLGDGGIEDLGLPFSTVVDLAPAGGSSFVVLAGTPTAEASVTRVSLADGAAVARSEVLRPGRDHAVLGIDSGYVSVPEPIDFPSANGRTAHALLYMPANAECTGPDGELPPLMAHVHGGPTSAAWPTLSLPLQYLTSRGFAVVDVNYGGSSGYGRPYRDLLRGAWGIVDVEDCVAAASYLAREGRVDPARLCISGGSAGGYTTLACLARAETPFAAGGDRYGVADLEALAVETHKFESHYLDSLVGPYPQERERYRERSPIHHVEDFSRPLIVLQGLEDEVVPPNQATMIVDALRAKGVPVAYLGFEGEQHGFRQEANIRRALDAELSFYAQIFGFELPAEEGIEPVAIVWP